MNYGEEIAYWYLRLNGFFPITNFVIHKSGEITHTSECDLLALRMPFVYEEIGGNPEDWDWDLADHLSFDRVIGVICEVKTGKYNLDEIFRSEYIQYAVGRLGLVLREQIARISQELNKCAIIETTVGDQICKLLIANEHKKSQNFIFIKLSAAEDFINKRVKNI